MQGLVRHGLIAIGILGLAAGGASAQGKPDQPVDLSQSGGDVQPVTGQDEHSLAISGFGVGGIPTTAGPATTPPPRERWRCRSSAS